MKTFADTALGEGVRKYPKVTLAKMAVTATAPPSAEGVDGDLKRKSKVQRSKAAAIEAFGGAALDELPVKKKAKL